MKNWQGKKVVIVGAARQGLALARYLTRQGARVVLNDLRPAEALAESMSNLDSFQVEWVLGGHPLTLLEGADLFCLSGGIDPELPLIVAAKERGIPLANDTQIYLETCPCPVIGITGSAGKTTTTSLVGKILADWSKSTAESPGRPRHVFVGGNIGNPLLDDLVRMQTTDLAVMEVSSFQLELTRRSPQVAVVLNITPNHLDRHGTFQAYRTAKANIITHQDSQDICVLGREDPIAWSLKSTVKGRLITFGLLPAPALFRPEQDRSGPAIEMDVCLDAEWLVLMKADGRTPILPRSEIRLRGSHNLLNVLAACAIAAAAGCPVEHMRQAVRDFAGVAHRLEFVRRVNQVDWYDDSIATAPERAMAGIRAFEEPLILLAGGRDKNLPWQGLVDLICRRVDHLVSFGEHGPQIDALVRAHREARPHSIDLCRGLADAVRTAGQVSTAGDVVLLSPGGTSFDEFKDYEERGEAYKQWVNELS